MKKTIKHGDLVRIHVPDQFPRHKRNGLCARVDTYLPSQSRICRITIAGRKRPGLYQSKHLHHVCDSPVIT